MNIHKDRIIGWIKSWVEAFNESPFQYVITLIAYLILMRVTLSLIGNVFGLTGISYVDNWVEGGFELLAAWILLSSNVTRFILGLFLTFSFMVSMALLIMPVNETMELMERSIRTIVDRNYDLSMEIENVENMAQIVTRRTNLIRREGYFSRNFRDGFLEELERFDLSIRELKEEYRRARLDEEDKIVLDVVGTIARHFKTSAPLIFALLMGALGSSITISRQFANSYDEHAPIWYAYRLFQGMVMAFLFIYGLFAGMLTLTNKDIISAAEFEQVKYFIGFVSAMAGLFSEKAFAKLEEVSETIFGKTRNASGQGGEAE